MHALHARGMHAACMPACMIHACSAGMHSLEGRAFKEEKDEQLFSVAFKEMASTIQSFLDNGRAYDMSSLLTMYQHI